MIEERPFPFSVRASQRIYRWLLRAFPDAYRREFAQPMEQLFRDCAADTFSESGYLGLAGLWWRTIGDYLCSLPREYGRTRNSVATTQKISIARLSPGAMDTFKNCTEGAKKMLAQAQKESVRLGHACVDTEHLLLGLLFDRSSAATRALVDMGLNPETVRTAVEKEAGTVPCGTLPWHFTSYSLSGRAGKTLTLACREAKLQQSNLSTTHVLLGLLRESDGVAARVLSEFGVDLDRGRNQLKLARVSPAAHLPNENLRFTRLPREDLFKTYVGHYLLSPSYVVAITADRDQLYAQATNRPCRTMKRMSADHYAFIGVGNEVSFERDRAGQIVGAMFYKNGMIQWAPKLAPGQLRPEPKEIPLTQAEAAEYVGDFGGPPFKFTVMQKGGQLAVKFAEHEVTKVFACAQDVFF
jgi:hypothetical protein